MLTNLEYLGTQVSEEYGTVVKVAETKPDERPGQKTGGLFHWRTTTKGKGKRGILKKES